LTETHVDDENDDHNQYGEFVLRELSDFDIEGVPVTIASPTRAAY
jgi:hypothetical protein